ncbi:MAG: Txe/YoeB family addiction module toxin [Thiobacillus sp.]
MKFTRQAAADLEFWKRSNPATVRRIKRLLNDIEASPFSGLGKPEALKHDLAGWWSRRITGEHRLVYRVNNGQIEVASLRFHYAKPRK